jgi:hypothetical protein
MTVQQQERRKPMTNRQKLRASSLALASAIMLPLYGVLIASAAQIAAL